MRRTLRSVQRLALVVINASFRRTQAGSVSARRDSAVARDRRVRKPVGSAARARLDSLRQLKIG